MPKTTAQKRAAAVAKRRGLVWSVAIEAWEYYYSFGPQWLKEARNPWTEIADLSLNGLITSPQPIRPSITLRIFGSMERRSTETQVRPTEIGHYQVGKDRIDAAVWIPMDAMAQLAAIGASIKHVHIEADVPERRQGGVRSIAVATQVPPVE